MLFRSRSSVEVLLRNLSSHPLSLSLAISLSSSLPPSSCAGYTLSLVKEATVHAGYLELKLRVFDLQGQQAVHNLSVTVCECSQIQHCDLRSATQLGGGTAIGILLALLLLGR